MDAGIGCQFRMERRYKLTSLTCSDDAVFDDSKDIYAVTYLLYVWSTNECHRVSSHPANLSLSAETAELPAIGIAVCKYVHRTEMATVEHNESGTCSEGRHAVDNGIADRLKEFLVADDAHHCRTLTTRDDDTLRLSGGRVEIFVPVAEITYLHSLSA